MPLARERSRMEAPSYPFLQKTSVAWARISARRRSKRVACETAGCRRDIRVAVEGLPIVLDASAYSNVRSNAVYGNAMRITSPQLPSGSSWPTSLPGRVIRPSQPNQSVAQVSIGGEFKGKPTCLLHLHRANTAILLEMRANALVGRIELESQRVWRLHGARARQH